VFKTTVCRGADGECDVAETCTGQVATCPADAFKPNGSGCSSDQNVCTNDVCNGSGTCTHPNNHADCDDGLACTEGDQCSGGTCSGEEKDCADEDQCTLDTCSESLGGLCQHANVCNDICRRPGWWGKRGVDVVQDLLDSADGLEVCGQSITTTAVDNGDNVDDLGLSSALEGLCVAVDGTPIRRLYRELVTAALNCTISGRPDNCDAVVSQFVDVSFSDCNELCEIGDGSSQAARRCAAQLDCYNSGGRFDDGKCSYGDCNITGELCGGDYGACPPVSLITHIVFQKCERFEGNCRDELFCNTGLDVPRGCDENSSNHIHVTSSDACKDAKDNDCTIDDCE
jgi:hypothetical protein